MFRQVLSLTAIPEVPENITQRKVIVYKSRVDPSMLKQKAEVPSNFRNKKRGNVMRIFLILSLPSRIIAVICVVIVYFCLYLRDGDE